VILNLLEAALSSPCWVLGERENVVRYGIAVKALSS
jgi:hypothetical protein